MKLADLNIIGNKIYEIRTRKLMKRIEVSEKIGLSERAYADIERGNVNMRIENFLKICLALDVTPNDILIIEEADDIEAFEKNLIEKMGKCSFAEKQIVLKIVSAYLDSLQ